MADIHTPWEKHALLSPTCTFLIQQKGTMFIESTQRIHYLVNSLQSRLTLLENSYAATPYRKCLPNECSICLDKPSDIVLIPCGHICMCNDCINKTAKPVINTSDINTYYHTNKPKHSSSN